MSSAAAVLQAHETSKSYSVGPLKDLTYEVSLKTQAAAPWLADLPQACRLIQALTHGQLLDEYEILDFLIWAEGFFLRVKLHSMPALSDFLTFLREKTTGTGEGAFAWEDELQWIRLVPPEKLAESTRDFLDKAERLQSELRSQGSQASSVFFFYRNRRPLP